MYQAKFAQKMRTHIIGFENDFFYQKSSRFRDNVEECGRSRKATNDSVIWRMRFVALDN